MSPTIAIIADEASPEGPGLAPGVYTSTAFVFHEGAAGFAHEGSVSAELTIAEDGGWQLRVVRLRGDAVLLDEAGRGPIPWAALGQAVILIQPPTGAALPVD